MGNENVRVSNLRTLVIGCTPLARKVVSLLDDISDLIGVVNLTPSKGALKSNYDCMSSFAKENSYNIFWTEDINNRKTLDWIKQRKPEVIIQCGWSQIFKPELLSIPEKYCIGIHPSPLPVGRGAAVINWKIIESNQRSIKWGNSLFIMEEKTDTGDVLDYEPFMIDVRDDVRTTYLKVDKTSIDMLKRTIPKIADGSISPSPQDNSKATRYRRRSPEDGKIDHNWPVNKIASFVRALTHPYPGAFLETNYGKIFIWKLAPQRFHWQSQEVGKVMSISKEGLLTSLRSGEAMSIGRVSNEENIEMWADDWAREVGISVGDKLFND